MSAATYSRVVGKGKGNPCHNPAGSSTGGQFCETGGGSRFSDAGFDGSTNPWLDAQGNRQLPKLSNVNLTASPLKQETGTSVMTARTKLLDGETIGRAPLKEVAVDDLYGWQAVVMGASLRPFDAATAPPLRIVKWQDRLIVYDGNNRAAAAWASGAKTVKANVLDLDDPKNKKYIQPKYRATEVGKSFIVKKTFYSFPIGHHYHSPISKSNPERNAIIDAADSMRTRVSTALIRTVEVVKDGISLKMLEDKLQQTDLNGVLQVLDLDKRFQAAAKGAGLQPNETSFLEAIKDTWAAGARAELDSLNMVPVHKSNPCHVPSGPKGGQFCEIGGGPRRGKSITITDTNRKKITVVVETSTVPPPLLRTGGYGTYEFKAYYKDKKYYSAQSAEGGYQHHENLGRALGFKGEEEAVGAGYVRIEGTRESSRSKTASANSVSLSFDPTNTKTVHNAEQVLRDIRPETLFVDFIGRNSKGQRAMDFASVHQSIGEGAPETRIVGLAREASRVTFGKSWSSEEEFVLISKASDTIGLMLAFDLLNPDTIAWLSTYVMALIQQVSDETRRAIADVVMNAFQYGGHPYEQARTIRNMIGLTQQQSQAVANFRRMLENEPLAALTRDLRDRRFDSTLQNIGRLKGQLSKEQIDKMVDAYYRKYLKYRSEMIARTETIRAARQGQEETWRQAIAQGLLPQGMRRKWIVTHDDRLCENCKSIPKLNPEGRGMDEQFMSDIGVVDGPPLHPHCRCAIVRKVDWNA